MGDNPKGSWHVGFGPFNWRVELISLISKRTLLSLATAVLAVLILLAAALVSGSSYEAKPALPPAADLAGFSALAPIDAHVHLYKDDPAFGALMQRLNLRVLRHHCD